METQHRAVLTTVARLTDPELIVRRDRAELVRVCDTLADWLRQYIEVAVEQNAEIKRLTSEQQITAVPPIANEPGVNQVRADRVDESLAG